LHFAWDSIWFEKIKKQNESFKTNITTFKSIIVNNLLQANEKNLEPYLIEVKKDAMKGVIKLIKYLLKNDDIS